MKYIILFLLAGEIFYPIQAMHTTEQKKHLNNNPIPRTPDNPDEFEAWLEKLFNKMNDTNYFEQCIPLIRQQIKTRNLFDIYKHFIINMGDKPDYTAQCWDFIMKQPQESHTQLTFLLDSAFIPYIGFPEE